MTTIDASKKAATAANEAIGEHPSFSVPLRVYGLEKSFGIYRDNPLRIKPGVYRTAEDLVDPTNRDIVVIPSNTVIGNAETELIKDIPLSAVYPDGLRAEDIKAICANYMRAIRDFECSKSIDNARSYYMD